MRTKLWLRYLDKYDLQAIAGTEGASFPFWSPDSKSIAYFVETNTTLRRLDLSTGISQILCRTHGSARGGPGDLMERSSLPRNEHAIQKVPAKGGILKTLQN